MDDRTRGEDRQTGRGEDRLRRRLADALSSAGVSQKRVAIELLYMLPAEFVRGYEDLFHRALDTGEGGRGDSDARKVELGRAAGKPTPGGMQTKGGRGGSGRAGGVFPVKDDRALGEKERIDRQLRKLARQMRDGGGAGTGKELVHRCGEDLPDVVVKVGDKTLQGVRQDSGKGCGRWVENSWKYCPNCGRKQG